MTVVVSSRFQDPSPGQTSTCSRSRCSLSEQENGAATGQVGPVTVSGCAGLPGGAPCRAWRRARVRTHSTTPSAAVTRSIRRSWSQRVRPGATRTRRRVAHPVGVVRGRHPRGRPSELAEWTSPSARTQATALPRPFSSWTSLPRPEPVATGKAHGARLPVREASHSPVTAERHDEAPAMPWTTILVTPPGLAATCVPAPVDAAVGSVANHRFSPMARIHPISSRVGNS